MHGKVYLIGAGPGDPELLTVKGLRLIKEADIIFYDYLIGSKILEYSKKDCQLVFVGKKSRCHIVEQEETCRLLVEAAKKHKTVVRLKGGDSFIFGRGGEECICLNEHHIPYEIVPGISSSIGAPTYAGIPVTHRKTARSFTVITGHQAEGKEKLDWSLYAKLETLVILMGVYNRVKIAKALIEGGRDENEAIAFIEQATTANQKVIVSTLKDVANGLVDVQSPAVTVIGEVVKLHNQLKWFSSDFNDNHFSPIELTGHKC